MSVVSAIGDYRPRKAAGLPLGQREVNVMPRFSDDPLRPAPPVGEPIVEIVVDDDVSVSVDLRSVEIAAVERPYDFHCVTGWTHLKVAWGGVALRELVTHACPEAFTGLATFAAVYGADGRHAVFSTEDLLDPSVLLATALDGAPISARHGGSVRLVSPKQYGYKNVKHVTRIAFFHEQPAGSFGKKEHLRARVAHEERHATLPNWLLRLPYRLMVVPTALASDWSQRHQTR